MNQLQLAQHPTVLLKSPLPELLLQAHIIQAPISDVQTQTSKLANPQISPTCGTTNYYTSDNINLSSHTLLLDDISHTSTATHMPCSIKYKHINA